MPTPRELVAHLNEYIIGQERVKETLAVAVVNHYKPRARRRDQRSQSRGGRGLQEQCSPDRPDGLRQDRPGPDPGPPAARPVRHRPTATLDRGRLRRRGRREPDPQARDGGDPLRIPAAEKGIIYIEEIDKNRQTSQTSRSPATCRARANSSLAQAARGDHRQRSAAGGAKAPGAAVPPGQHPDILSFAAATFVGLERSSQATGPQDDRLRRG